MHLSTPRLRSSISARQAQINNKLTFTGKPSYSAAPRSYRRADEHIYVIFPHILLSKNKHHTLKRADFSRSSRMSSAPLGKYRNAYEQ